MGNCTVVLVSIALAVFLGPFPVFATSAQVPEPSSLALAAVGIGAAALYAFLKRKR